MQLRFERDTRTSQRAFNFDDSSKTFTPNNSLDIGFLIFSVVFQEKNRMNWRTRGIYLDS